MIRITRAGWIYTALTIVIGFSAVNTANNLVYIIAAALLSYMLISGIFGRRNIQKLEVQMEMPEEIYANTLTPLQVHLINHRRFLPAFLIKVLIEEQEVLFKFVEAGSRASQPLNMRFPRRGKVSIERIRLSSIFPFNFFTRYKSIEKRRSLLVFPEPKPCDWRLAVSNRKKHKGDEASRNLGYDSDLISIRDYMSGDPLKYICWKSTAKTGVLKTKELASMQFHPLIIDFDKVNIKNLELKISCITYLTLKLFRTGAPFGLILDGETFRPEISRTSKINILRRLALYGEN